MFERKTETTTAESFDNIEIVRKYARAMEKMAPMYNGFLKFLQSLNPGQRMLEIGPGTGLLTYRVAQLYPQANITALELSPMIAMVGEEYIKSKGVTERVKWIIGNAEDAQLVNGLGKFDLIYCSLVLHEFSDPGKILRQYFEVLNKNGYLAFLDLRRAWWLYWIPSNAGFFRSIRAALQPNELEDIFEKIDIKDRQVRTAFPFLIMASGRKQ